VQRLFNSPALPVQRDHIRGRQPCRVGSLVR
jgi:hypothetical protein